VVLVWGGAAIFGDSELSCKGGGCMSGGAVTVDGTGDAHH